MQELETGELGPQDAAARIIEELGGNGNDGTGQRPSMAPGEPEPRPTSPNGGDVAEPWRLLIAAKDETIGRLESEVSFLRQRIEHLEPLALPAPRGSRRGVFSIFRRKASR
jgi:hypothetical protein